MTDRHRLSWSYTPENQPSLPPPPDGLTRRYIPTPSGNLELIWARPSAAAAAEEEGAAPGKRKKAIIFQHGGFGCASVWIPFLRYFADRGYPCYAVSLRGHGGSWKPSYWRMVWGTGIGAMARDLGSAVEWVKAFEFVWRGRRLEDGDLVLVGHSAGGGLVQYFLDRGKYTVGGLVIVAGFPCFGGYGVYWNWFKHDPWFVPRYYIRDLWHPRSPLSSTTLVHGAFFSPEYPREQVSIFEKMLPAYESMLWPLQMMFPFVNIRNVLKNIVGWGNESKQRRLLVIAGEKDNLMGVRLMEKMAALYRITLGRIFSAAEGKEKDIRGHETGTQVQFEVIEGSGHHVQNDLQWEVAAGKVLEFVEQL
ncbi:Alpha/Beta hydrolase protein [Bisporella sp. PMI_857]|nr:Alpha/Beta hydrolase protein [Bisporella sp. PMI_857]